MPGAGSGSPCAERRARSLLLPGARGRRTRRAARTRRGTPRRDPRGPSPSSLNGHPDAGPALLPVAGAALDDTERPSCGSRLHGRLPAPPPVRRPARTPRRMPRARRGSRSWPPPPGSFRPTPPRHAARRRPTTPWPSPLCTDRPRPGVPSFPSSAAPWSSSCGPLSAHQTYRPPPPAAARNVRLGKIPQEARDQMQNAVEDAPAARAGGRRRPAEGPPVRAAPADAPARTRRRPPRRRFRHLRGLSSDERPRGWAPAEFRSPARP
jgi:hypothetical protein